MKRFAMQYLKKWKAKENRKPLVIRGGAARWQNLAYERVREKRVSTNGLC